MPLLRVLVLALAFAHAVGVSDFVEAACAADCTEDDCDDGRCPPICPSCQCAPRSPINVTVVMGLGPVRLPTSLTAFPARDDAPASPDPREILRVPIVRSV